MKKRKPRYETRNGYPYGTFTVIDKEDHGYTVALHIPTLAAAKKIVRIYEEARTNKKGG